MSKATIRDHDHGTYLAYLHDVCRCRPCTTAWNVYQQQLKSRHARGEVWADPATYRRLLGPFVRAGVSPTALFRATGVRPATARALMEGRRVRRAYASKVDDVTWDDFDDRTLVRAELFRGHRDALLDRGLTHQDIANLLGWSAWPGGDYPTPGRRVQLGAVRLLERAAGRTEHGAPEDPRCVDCHGPAWAGGLRCQTCYAEHARPSPFVWTGCGTDAGYTRHRRAGEMPCQACRTAHSAARHRGAA